MDIVCSLCFSYPMGIVCSLSFSYPMGIVCLSLIYSSDYSFGLSNFSFKILSIIYT